MWPLWKASNLSKKNVAFIPLVFSKSEGDFCDKKLNGVVYMEWHKILSKAKRMIECEKNDEAKDILGEHLDNIKSGDINLHQLEISLHNYVGFLEFAHNNSNRSDIMLEYVKHALDNLEYIKTSVKKLQNQI